MKVSPSPQEVPKVPANTSVQAVSPEMHSLLSRLRYKCAISYVSGSYLAKRQEQLSTPSVPVTSLFDFCFAKNGLTAFKMGVPLSSTSIDWIGETK
jgi:phosphomannomutase